MSLRVGLLSDTHGFLDPTLHEHFQACDEIWHAGDIGDLAVTRKLKSWKPLRAVYGNIDNQQAQIDFPEDEVIHLEGITLLMTHIAGPPPAFTKRVRQLIDDHHPQVIICGHSHILKVKRDEKSGILYLNPGAAGQHGFHTMRTAMRLTIAAGKISDLEVIELGKRGALS